MTDDIKVGDVCVIVAPASHALVGSECEVIGEEKTYEKTIITSEAFEMVAWCRGFLVRVAIDGRRYCIERRCLRKKRPPADQDQVVRQQTVPREDFEKWLQRVRKQQREEEPA